MIGLRIYSTERRHAGFDIGKIVFFFLFSHCGNCVFLNRDHASARLGLRQFHADFTQNLIINVVGLIFELASWHCVLHSILFHFNLHLLFLELSEHLRDALDVHVLVCSAHDLRGGSHRLHHCLLRCH